MSDSEINQAVARITGQVRSYCDSLDDMHEAEQQIDLDLYVAQLLATIHDVDPGYFNRVSWDNVRELITATSRQRAIAFLKVHGKYHQ